MQVLITGAAGFLGSKLAETLSKNDDIEKIVAYDNLSSGSFDYLLSPIKGKYKIKPIVGDILDSRSLDIALKGIDVVVHVAHCADDDSFHRLEQVNNWGTSEVISAFERSNASRFIHISNTRVYGSNKDNQELLDPSTHYEWSLVRAEEHVRRIISAGKGAILRVGELYGLAPAKATTSGINSLIFDAYSGKKLRVEGNGNLKRNLSDIDVAAENIVDLMFNSQLNGIYNSIDYSLSTMELLQEVKNIYPELEVIFLNHHYENDGVIIKKSAELGSEAPSLYEAFIQIKRALE